MAFTIADLSDLKQLLTEHPDWRAEIRRLILSEQFEEMPEILRGLAEG